MTREERLKWLKQIEKDIYVCSIESDLADDMKSCIKSCAIHSAIEELEQEPCEDAISKQAVEEIINDIRDCISIEGYCAILERVKKLPPVTPKPKTVYCKECKYFEYDSVAKVDGIPLIVAHEICKKWGDGCKTSEDGYCFLFEPQESEG